jgi:hypothetical protein
MGCQSEPTKKTDSPLTNTYWKLTRLQGKAITTLQGNRETMYFTNASNGVIATFSAIYF